MNNNINIDNLVKILTKYLDRVEVKGLTEVRELSDLLNFVAQIQQGMIEISMREMSPPVSPDNKDQ